MNAAKKIWVAPYELKPRDPSLGLSVGVRLGSLLRAEFEDGKIGYADLHPWPELGDLSLAEQLRLLQGPEAGWSQLARQSLFFAEKDAEARARGVSLFEGVAPGDLPENHFLVSLSDLGFSRIEQALQEGFRVFKLKVGGAPREEVQALVRLADRLPSDAKLRLDFNARVSAPVLDAFLELVASLLDRVDFLEDPLPWNPNEWMELKRQWGLRMALDRAAEAKQIPFKLIGSAVDFLVIKPATQEAPVGEIISEYPLVVTSYLDHPLGQVSAAVFAARLKMDRPGKLGVCGLLSQGAYEVNRYSERLQVSGTRLLPPEGLGLGFDELLERENWELLQ